MGAKVLIGLGSNRPGRWGGPAATVKRAVAELARSGLRVEAASSLYETAPLGAGPNGAFVNAVVAADTSLPPEALLLRLKRIERLAGRRSARPWGPRALDLDLLDYQGLVRGWRKREPELRRQRAPQLVLPHPRLHLRPFVVGPLTEIRPRWRHPVLKRSARELWDGLQTQRQGRVLRRLAKPAPEPLSRARVLAMSGESA